MLLKITNIRVTKRGIQPVKNYPILLIKHGWILQKKAH